MRRCSRGRSEAPQPAQLARHGPNHGVKGSQVFPGKPFCVGVEKLHAAPDSVGCDDGHTEDRPGGEACAVVQSSVEALVALGVVHEQPQLLVSREGRFDGRDLLLQPVDWSHPMGAAGLDARMTGCAVLPLLLKPYCFVWTSSPNASMVKCIARSALLQPKSSACHES